MNAINLPRTQAAEPEIIGTSVAQVATLETFALNADIVLARKGMLQKVMERVMIEDTHYGKIPGCGNKPSLLKPGAEAISSTFQLCPRYHITKTELVNGHREYEIICDLLNPAGGFIGSGVGSCSTMEGKYRFRKAEQTCPHCGKATIIKGKKEYGGGWLCFQKKGGCGAKFNDGDPAIENQNMGQIEHDNPADYYNTVLKMGKKRAFVDAVLTATGASDIFTQDVEDMPEVIPGAQRQTQQPTQRTNAQSEMDDIPEYGQQQQAQSNTSKPISDQQKRKVYASCKQRGINLDDMCMSLSESNSFGRQIMRVTDLTGEEASMLISWVEDGSLDFLSKGQEAAA